jgi:hypothetical protein
MKRPRGKGAPPVTRARQCFWFSPAGASPIVSAPTMPALHMNVHHPTLVSASVALPDADLLHFGCDLPTENSSDLLSGLPSLVSDAGADSLRRAPQPASNAEAEEDIIDELERMMAENCARAARAVAADKPVTASLDQLEEELEREDDADDDEERDDMSTCSDASHATAVSNA